MLAPIAPPTAAPDLAPSGGGRQPAGRTGGFADALNEVQSAEAEQSEAAPRDRSADPAAAVPVAAAVPLLQDGMNAIRFGTEADAAVTEAAALDSAAPEPAMLEPAMPEGDAPDAQQQGAETDADMPADFAALLRQNGKGADQHAGQQGAPAQLPESATASAAGEADPALLDALAAADADSARPAGPTAQTLDATAPGTAELRPAAATPTGTAQQSQPAAPAAPVPLDAVAVRIAKSAADGIDRMRIELHPASLGGIDVSLEIGRDGRVDAVIRADRPETLELMQRDARQLARALQDAGLQADLSSFDFRQREDGAEGFARHQPEGASSRHVGTGDGIAPAATIDLIYRSARAGGLDLRV